MNSYIIYSISTLLIIVLGLFSGHFPKNQMLQLSKEIKFDFGRGKTGEDWFIMNDDVMGGLSKGEMDLTPHSLIFSGKISLENNGGYTFVRCPFGPLGLGNSTKMEIKYRSKGQTIGINLNNSQAWYKPYYKLLLKDTNYKWQEVELELSDALEYSRGKPNGKNMQLELVEEIKRLGFSNTELKEGIFKFEVDYIKFK
ncbi:MAG: CIA30 family protein [Bacteroidota bacterium]